MTSEIVPSLSVERARLLTDRIRSGIDGIRRDLLEIAQGQGWLALGYPSFWAWASGEFDVHPSHVLRHLEVAQLEASLGGEEMVGVHRESHLRPLVTILDNEADRLEAYRRVNGGNVTAADYQRAAWEVRVEKSFYPILIARLRAGKVAPCAAYEIVKLLAHERETRVVELGSYVSDPQLIPLLSVLAAKGRATFEEVYASRAIPTADGEAIPLSEATAQSLKAYVEVGSFEHRAASYERNRPWYEAERQAIDNVLVEARRVASEGSPLRQSLVELDRVREQRRVIA